jgi:hypothetical protein
VVDGNFAIGTKQRDRSHVVGEILLMLERVPVLSRRSEAAGDVVRESCLLGGPVAADGAMHDDSLHGGVEAEVTGFGAGTGPGAPLAACVLVFAGAESFAGGGGGVGGGVAAGEQT